MKRLFAITLLSATSLVAAAGEPSDAQVDAAFAKADADGNGTLTHAEARKFGITRKVFAMANPDKDGTLDKKEFLAAITHRFEQANPDKDGTLDRKEAARAGIKRAADFAAANPDNDGTLDLAEYLTALTAMVK